jgi:hypothetical protein
MGNDRGKPQAADVELTDDEFARIEAELATRTSPSCAPWTETPSADTARR